MTLTAVGKIVGCFGIKGYVRIRSLTTSPDRLKILKDVYLGASAERVVPSAVEDVILRKDAALVKLRTVNDRNGAESVAGQFIFVDDDHVATLPAGTFFVDDLIGCSVWSDDGHKLGVLKDVYRFPAQDVWAVDIGGRSALIPAVKEFVVRVDLQDRKIVIRPIDGLIEE